MIVTDAERLSDLGSLRAVTRDFLSTVEPHAGIDLEARIDRDLWSRACTELGAAGVDVPEHLGGSGFGAAALAVLQEEAGRALARVPILGTVVMGIGAIVAGSEQPVGDRFDAMLAGERVVGFCVQHDATVSALDRASGWELTGTAWPVVDGMSADDALVVATTPGGTTAFLVDLGGLGVERSPCRTLDLTRDAARVHLQGAPAQVVGRVDDWGRLSALVQPRFDLAVAAEALGSAEACLEGAVDYAATRVQFGRAIGSFQAIKHRLAELAVLIDDARSAVEHAAWCADEQPDSAALSAAVAVAAATRAHLQATADVVQVHGGIGFTWEHVNHLHLRRAESNALLFGDVPRRQEEVLRLMDL